MKFTELQLHQDLLRGIESAGYVECTPVQEQVLQAALDGADLYVQSQTGTGKTAAFLISIIQQLLVRGGVAGKKALVMVPTRELAVQVEEEARTLISGTSLKTGSFYGGVGYNKQTALLKESVDIIIGTPGRVIDLQESGTMDLSQVAFLVVDEADRMFDMGFYPDLRKLIKVLPKTQDRQTMLFSATLNTYVKNLAWEYTENPVEITIEAQQITVEEIDQQLLHVSSDAKMRLLLGILQSEKPESVIVFCNTKRSCEVVAKRLQYNGIESEFIIGDLPQSKRLQVLDSFKRGSLKCLVATDVAARGIDVDDLAMVVNYDLPNESENYVHRIGRTARAGKSGKAYTFCSEQDVYNLVPIERYLGHSIPSSVAYEDMMVEDKSASIYIRTGDYGEDERGGGRGRREGSRGRGDGGGRERRGGNRSGEARGSRGSGNNAPGEGRGGGRRGNGDARRKDTYRGKAGGRTYSRDGRQSAGDTQDLSGLTFDQRMKVYKEKYGGQAAAGTAVPSEGGRGEGGPSRRKGGQSGGRNRSRNGNGASGRQGSRPDNRQANRQKNGGHPGAVTSQSGQSSPNPKVSGQGHKSEGSQAAAQSAAKASQPPKQGFLARLKGLFGGAKASSDTSDNK
ncbi:MAG: DEAD/DEAH box helicase [Spirochaetaceae bacterium]|nr:DEAD/DEAH box helicase [Spirochaetaceae bacterium]